MASCGYRRHETGGFGPFPLETFDIAHGGSECNAGTGGKRSVKGGDAFEAIRQARRISLAAVNRSAKTARR
jgi:hypothetical protein